MFNRTLNKYVYKILLSIIKYIPILLSICFIINFICSYFNVILVGIQCFIGVSFLFIILLYLLSYVFKFCYLYRLPLHYITLSSIIGVLKQFGVITLSALGMYRLYFIIAGIALIVYVWLMYKNRNNPKVDPIKQLCETYCDCNC